jgi:class 3 adenylate cyclase
MSELAEWLKHVGLEKYEAVFEANEITLDLLPHLTAADIDSLGLPLGPRRRLTVEIQSLGGVVASVPVSAAPAAPPAQPSSAGGAERRQLTVMFCDLVGSTALAEQLDPEELRELIQSYRQACGDVVARYEGHVAQYLGDGLMVYFGWPVAHEDDAERGVRSALEMVVVVKAIRSATPLAVRIGLATGPVVVGDSSAGSTESKLAVGETPNLAARLQSLAGVDEVVIAPATRRLVGDAFALTDLGARSLKGIAEPVTVWRVDDVRRTEGRFDARYGAADLAAIVGREDEIAQMLRRWQQARNGEGQVILISGEAGIGKSRLTQVLREQIAEPHASLRYQCSPYHLHSALYPFIEQFEYAAKFGRDDTPDQRLDKMEQALIGTPKEIAEWAPLFAAVLSLPVERYPAVALSPQKRKEKTLEAMAGQIVARATRGPLIMVFEDVHWIDPTSQELLDTLIPKLGALPVLFAATFRPDYRSPWVGLAGVTSIILTRLGQKQIAALIAEVTAGRPLPQEVIDEILSRTDGVPLFVEELTKSVLESGQLRETGEHFALQGGIPALAIPTSLRDSLVARLDRLASVKEIAQIGACIGREFSFELLLPISGLVTEQLQAALDKLVDSGLVTRRGSLADANYTFKHALVQDAAYDSLLRSRRSQLHGRIAQVLESDFGHHVSKQPEWLAHHHTQAGSHAAAIPLWRKAGELAIGRVALKEAVASLQKGLALIDELPPSAERDRLELTIREPLSAAWSALRGWAAPEVYDNATAVLRLAKSQHTTQGLLLGLWWVWTSTITQGRIAASATYAQQLLDGARESGDSDLLIFGHAATMVTDMLSGRMPESRVHYDRVLALYDPERADRFMQLTGYDLRTFVQVYACQLIWMMGYPDDAVRVAESSVAHAQRVGHAFNHVWTLTFSAYTYAYRREPDRFLAQIGEADRIARDQGIAFISRVSVPQAEGVASVLSGRPREAIASLRIGIERWTTTGGNVRVPYIKSALAEALALEGELFPALELIDECVEQIERPESQEREWLPEVLRLKAAIVLRIGREGEAAELLRASIDCAREQRAKSWELRSATNLAALLLRRGEPDAARALLAPIYGWFTEGFETPDLRDAKTLLDGLGV